MCSDYFPNHAGLSRRGMVLREVEVERTQHSLNRCDGLVFGFHWDLLSVQLQLSPQTPPNN